MSEKQCTKCDKVKPLDKFRKDSRERDGRRAYCKECARKADKEYRKRPEVQKREAAYQAGYKNPRAFAEKNPDALKAHNSVNNAVRAGVLARPSSCICVKCGNRAREYHHHNGYDASHVFDVIPLCRSCHRIAHSELV